MSKYNRFAKDLDAAFKTSRNVYAKTYSKYAQAERVAVHLWRSAPDDTDYSYVLRMAEAIVDCVEKKELFEEVRKNAWSVFNSKREKLRAELEKAIAADCITDLAAPDTNAVYLLDSGTMTAADYAAFAEKYDGNPTMLKLIAARAHAAAESAEPKERAALNQVYSDCKGGNGAILRLWDDISRVANLCSGQCYEDCKDSPAVIVEMGKRWEELTANVIENF